MEGFRDGRLAEDSMWQAVITKSKGGGEYCGINLVEVVCKVMAFILNCRLINSISFHNVLHSFGVSRITRTASLESKLLHKLMAMR